MTTDLQEIFAGTGQVSPRSTVDLDLVLRKGRRLRARRRAAVGMSGVLGVAVLGSGAAALLPWDPTATSQAPASGGVASLGASASIDPAVVDPVPSAHTFAAASVPASASPSLLGKGGPPPADLAAVSLPDPAPGFALRRFADAVDLTTIGAQTAPQWVATFGLGKVPESPLLDGAGTVVGSSPNGPQVTILVGRFELPVPAADGRIEGHDVVATPTVAGVTGWVTSFAEKDDADSELYFSTGAYSIEIVGFGTVTADELVALGNALSGLK